MKVKQQIPALGLLVVSFAVTAWLLLHAYPMDTFYPFDFIEGGRIFHIDDAYRYYEGRAAWSSSTLWSWVYVLPVDLLYKGGISFLMGGDISLMRLTGVAVNLLGAAFLYQACLSIKISKFSALLSLTLLVFMPLFVVVAMSFFGESLLTAVVSLVVYCYIKSHWKMLCLLASLMPLIQPEGFFMLLPFFLYFVKRRLWWHFVALGLPGFVYFLWLLYSYGGRLDEYLALHFTITKLYPALPSPIFERGWLAIPVTLNPILVLFFLHGVWLSWWKLWPLYSSLFVWIAFYVAVVMPLQGYEPRFLTPCLPIMVAGVAVSLDRVRQFSAGPKLVPALILFVLLENFGQVDAFRSAFMAERRWPTGHHIAAMPTWGPVHFDSSRYGADMARRVEAFLDENEEFSWLIVQDHDFFYYLDPQEVRRDVRVCFAPFRTLSVYIAFQNRFFCMSPDAPRSGFFAVSSLPESKEGAPRALFVGSLALYGLPEAYSNPRFRVYEISYTESSPPERLTIFPRFGDDLEQFLRIGEDELEFIYPDW
ncbi:hypothetical protein [Alcanivorax quisquiliarum]|uniref:Glycosyltransferase RgtA/B/C/D-like domain-containing protein n=1 Tax=Alcanivorax quisquiliarum TaxID=2933565 RepID=A0ABT0E3K7_9GAMM|nr:hypothetical protein [Alcanivorax quisquiliarum]MCK0536394.1 hypothetical protein [Alcanivorax quisquiliarum]